MTAPDDELNEMIASGHLTIKEAMAFLNVPSSTLYELMASGELRYTQLTPGRRRIYRKSAEDLSRRGAVLP